MHSFTDLRTLGLIGGLLLAAASSPAHATESIRLSDTQLDAVSAGATATVFTRGGARARGSLYSFSLAETVGSGSGNDDGVSASGMSLAFGFGADRRAGGAAAAARTGGTADGDLAFTVPINLDFPIGPFAAFDLSVTLGFAASN